MRYLWKAASLHRHGESLATDAPDLTVLRRHLHSLQKRGLLERRLVEDCGLNRDAMKLSCKTTQSARVVITRKSRQKSIVSVVAKGNTTGDPDLVDLVAKTDWIVLEARVGLTEPELRSGSWWVEEP